MAQMAISDRWTYSDDFHCNLSLQSQYNYSVDEDNDEVLLKSKVTHERPLVNCCDMQTKDHS